MVSLRATTVIPRYLRGFQEYISITKAKHIRSQHSPAEVRKMAYILSPILMVLQVVTAHTWIEQLSSIDNSGVLSGDPGFIRGYGKRYYQSITLLQTNRTTSTTDKPGLYR